MSISSVGYLRCRVPAAQHLGVCSVCMITLVPRVDTSVGEAVCVSIFDKYGNDVLVLQNHLIHECVRPLSRDDVFARFLQFFLFLVYRQRCSVFPPSCWAKRRCCVLFLHRVWRRWRKTKRMLQLYHSSCHCPCDPCAVRYVTYLQRNAVHSACTEVLLPTYGQSQGG